MTPDQQAFVEDAIATGRLRGAADAVREALSLWEQRERARAEILADVDRAEASLARGMGRPVTEESMQLLAGDVKKRGRALVAAGENSGP